MVQPAFRTGSDAAKEANKRASFARTEYFGLDDGQQAIVRFITPHTEWLTAEQHQMVPTKTKPADFDGNWPEKMGAICRNEQAFAGAYASCWICDNVEGKPSKRAPRTWAIACLREEVLEGGKVVGLKDQTREVTRKKAGATSDDDTETVVEKAVVVMRLSWQNFFSVLEGFAHHYGTILDRDYVIRRQGAGLDTKYQIVPLDPIQMEDGSRYTLETPEVAARYVTGLDLIDVMTRQSSDEFYARFFDPALTIGDGGEVVPVGAGTAPKPTNEVAAARLEALAARVTSYANENGDEKPKDEKPKEDGEPVTAMKNVE